MVSRNDTTARCLKARGPRRVPALLTLDQTARVMQNVDSTGRRIIYPQVVNEALAMMPGWQLSCWDALMVIAA